ncbi:MAG: hypothetical protein ABI718_01405 [Acidobacteriota bacterium]
MPNKLQPILILLTSVILAGGCAKKEQRAAAVVENMAQALRNEAADSFSKPPQAHSDQIETGTGRFESQFSEDPAASKDGVTTRPFRLTIRNRSAEPQKFQSTIHYLDGQGQVVRTKSLAQTVVAPYAEHEVAGVFEVPDKVAVRIKSAKPEVIAVKWDEDRGSEAPPSGTIR